MVNQGIIENLSVSKRKNISGVATLTMTMLILLITAGIVLYTNNTGVFEQNISANQYRSEQALAAAQAGLDNALEYYNRYDSGATVLPPATLNSGTSLANSSYSVRFCDLGLNKTTYPNRPSIQVAYNAFVTGISVCNALSTTFNDVYFFKIESEGFSDDRSGRRVIAQLVSGGVLLNTGGGPSQPLLARASVGLTGNITVVNRYTNATVWSGGVAGTASNSVTTYINDGSLNPGTATRADLRALPANSSAVPANTVLASKADLGLNSDVRDNDQTLNKMTPLQLFESFFASSPTAIEGIATSTSKRFTTLAGAAGQTGLIWVEGNQSGSMSIGNTTASTIVVVNGNLTMNGGTTYGLVFVRGDVSFSGNPIISGALIATGTIGSNGTPRIVYDPSAFAQNPQGPSGLRSKVVGTWKDW